MRKYQVRRACGLRAGRFFVFVLFLRYRARVLAVNASVRGIEIMMRRHGENKGTLDIAGLFVGTMRSFVLDHPIS